MPQLDFEIAGNFGDLFPNLQKLLQGVETLREKNTGAMNSLNTGIKNAGSGLTELTAKLQASFNSAINDSEKLKTNLPKDIPFLSKSATDLKLVSEELRVIISRFVELADVAIDASREFATGNSVQATALKNQIQVLESLRQKIKEATDPVSAQKLGTQIGLVTQNVVALAVELKKVQDTSLDTEGFKVEPLKLVSAEVENIANKFTAVANASIAGAAEFVRGETVKHNALKVQLATLDQLKIKLRDANNPADAARLGAQITAVSKTVNILVGDIRKAGEGLKNLQPGDQLENKFSSLRSLINQARAEAFFLMETLGENHPQAVAAQKNLANLNEKLDDLNRRVQALNPEAKFQVFSQLAQGIAGGFAAAQGAVALFGSKSEQVEKVLLRVNAALALSQGINQIFQLKDVFSSLTVVLGINTGAQRANTFAKETDLAVTKGLSVATSGATLEKIKGAAASGTLTVATGAQTTAQIIAAAATRALGAAFTFLTGPVGIVFALFAGGLAIFELFGNSAEKTKEDISKLNGEIDNFIKQIQRTNDLRKTVTSENLTVLRSQQQAELAQFEAGENKKVEQVRESYAQQQILAQQNLSTKQDFINQELQLSKISSQQSIEEVKQKQDAETRLFELKLRQTRQLQLATATQAAQNVGFIESEVQALLVANDLLRNELPRTDEEDQQGIKDQIKANEEQMKQLLAEKIKAAIASATIAREGKAEEEKISAELTSKLLADRQELRDELLKVQKELTDGLADLAGRARDAELSLLTQDVRIEAERRIGEESINNLEQTLIAKEQAVVRSNAVIEGLSKEETEKRVAAVKLTVGQEQQLEILRAANAKIFADKKFQFEQEAQKQLIELTKRGDEQKLALLDVDLANLEKELRSKGTAEEKITIAVEVKKLEGVAKIKEERIGLEAETNKAIVDGIKIAGVSEEQAERIREEKKLQIDLEAAQKRLAVKQEKKTESVSLGLDTKDLDNEIKTVEGLIEKLVREIDAKKREINQGQKISWASIFGITGTDAEAFNQAAGQFIDSSVKLYEAINAAAIQAAEQELKLSQEKIQRFDDELSALDDKIAKEEELNKNGFANNLDLFRQQKADLKKERDKEVAHQREINREKAKLAKQQAEVEFALQAVALITSTINTIKGFSDIPVVGWVLGLAAAAALIAGYIGLKGQIKALDAQSEFGGGGEVGGKPHTHGGTKYKAIDGSAKTVELEDGEFVTNKTQYKKHRKLTRAINERTYDTLDVDEVMPFVKPEQRKLARAYKNFKRASLDIEQALPLLKSEQAKRVTDALIFTRRTDIEKRKIFESRLFENFEIKTLTPVLNAAGVLLQRDIAAPILETRNTVNKFETTTVEANFKGLEKRVDDLHETIRSHFEKDEPREMTVDGKRIIHTRRSTKIV